MQPDAIRQGSARKTSMGGNQSKHQLDRQFIEERDEEHFESAKGSIRGDSNFQSVIEYDNSQYAMDGRFNPLMLKKKPTSEYYQEQSGKVYAKAPSPNQFGNQSRLAMSGGQQSPYNQIRDAPQTRIPSNRLIHISAPYQPQPNLGMNQSVQSGSQFSVNPSYYKGPAQGSSPQNMIQAQKVSSPTNLKMHPFIEVRFIYIGFNKQQQSFPAISCEHQ